MNDSTPAISATNLQNIEDAIDDIIDNGFTASGKFLAMIWDGFQFFTSYSQVLGIIAIVFVILMFMVLLRYRVNKKTGVVLLAFFIIFSSGFVMSSKYVSIKNTIAQSELYSLG